MDQAAAIGIPCLAAWSALVKAGQIKTDETVLGSGVSGAVGRAAAQIAHWKKAHVIGASTSLDNPSCADAIIDTTTQDLASEVRALTDGKGSDLVLDLVGGTLFEPCVTALRHGARQIAIASMPQVVSFNLVDFYHGDKHLLGAGFEQRPLQPPTTQTWTFGQAVEA